MRYSLSQSISHFRIAAQALDSAGHYRGADSLHGVLIKMAQESGASWQRMQNTPGLSNMSLTNLDNSALGFSMGLTHTPGQATNFGGAAHGSSLYRNIQPGETPEAYAMERNNYFRQHNGLEASVIEQWRQYLAKYPYILDEKGKPQPNPQVQMLAYWESHPGTVPIPGAEALPPYATNAQGQQIPNPALYGESGINFISAPTNVPSVSPELPIQPYQPLPS